MPKPLALAALLVLLAASPSLPAAEAESRAGSTHPADDPDLPGTYWLRQQEGWFWYREPPPRKPDAAPKAKAPPRELTDFEAMQKRLDELKRIAVMNPTDANLLAYMRYQRLVMNRSEVFAKRWQRLVWTTPELDYGLTGRPTNAMAVGVFDGEARDRQAQAVRGLAATHALVFVFRSDCPYCHRFAPILKRFEQEHGLRVYAVSLDGKGLPEYPDARPDNGIAARLDARSVPALYLTAPARREIRPVGFGLMAETDLLERIAALAARPENPL